MPATALARQPPAHALPIPAKRVRLPPRVAKAVRLLVTGECKTQKAAAERAGICASHLCEQLTRPKIQAFVAQETRRALQNGTLRATARFLELLDAKSEPVSAQVAQRLLTDQGILKSDQRDINVDVRLQAGFVIDLTSPTAKPTADNPTITTVSAFE